MAKNVGANHTVKTNTDDNGIETLLKNETNAEVTQEVVEPETNTEEVKEVKKDKKEDGKTRKIVLIKAASYSGGGLRFIKNVPVTIADEVVYNRLMSTGLFEAAL
jgi:hypothetical protein